MSTWVKEHFRDAQNARETLAVAVVAAAALGLGVVLFGLWAVR